MPCHGFDWVFYTTYHSCCNAIIMKARVCSRANNNGTTMPTKVLCKFRYGQPRFWLPYGGGLREVKDESAIFLLQEMKGLPLRGKSLINTTVNKYQNRRQFIFRAVGMALPKAHRRHTVYLPSICKVKSLGDSYSCGHKTKGLTITLSAVSPQIGL